MFTYALDGAVEMYNPGIDHTCLPPPASVPLAPPVSCHGIRWDFTASLSDVSEQSAKEMQLEPTLHGHLNGGFKAVRINTNTKSRTGKTT